MEESEREQERTNFVNGQVDHRAITLIDLINESLSLCGLSFERSS